MSTERAVRLLGVLATAVPWIALAWAGADPWLLGGLAVLLLAGIVSIATSPLRRHPSSHPELAAALDDVDAAIAEATEGWAAKVTRAETAGRFREEFVAAVRHELRTPLNAILGFADVLLEEVDGPLEPRQREDVEAIRSAGGYLSELVQAVLSEWSPRRGTPLPIAYVDVGALLGQVARILEGQLVGRDLRIVVDVPSDLKGPIADERRLRQALINLGTNALRATEEGEVRFEARAEADRVRLTVRDTGRGIDPDALPTLFTPFVQAGVPASREGGTGLGLSIVRELVEWHGGHIEVETKQGEGTAISLLLRRSVG
ncbi:MAG: HAMP domain-containing histidine kinase [Myxococcales bacterium]|nr:HAMP domain-containing histidine kinase [Myxococcales bacterium]